MMDRNEAYAEMAELDYVAVVDEAKIREWCDAFGVDGSDIAYSIRDGQGTGKHHVTLDVPGSTVRGAGMFDVPDAILRKLGKPDTSMFMGRGSHHRVMMARLRAELEVVA